MRYVLAFFLPGISLMLQGKIGAGIGCLFLEFTVIGWLPAVIWAMTSLNRMYADRRTNDLIKAMKHQTTNSNEVYNKPHEYLTNQEKARLYDEKFGEK
jgi:TM2 domain-containing membrane protein YozV